MSQSVVYRLSRCVVVYHRMSQSVMRDHLGPCSGSLSGALCCDCRSAAAAAAAAAKTHTIDSRTTSCT